MSPTKKGKPCSKTRTCAGMDFALSQTKGRTGIGFENILDLRTGRFSPLGYLYRGNAKDKGIVLNLCPWCGTDFAKLWPARRKSFKKESR